MARQPKSKALRKLGRVFSGASPAAPRCPITKSWKVVGKCCVVESYFVFIHVQLTWSVDAVGARLALMSYEVLARKLRPSRFAALVGQDHVVRALSHALDHDRLHHAYLFTGTRGVGKTAIARILAKSLNCEEGLAPRRAGSAQFA